MSDPESGTDGHGRRVAQSEKEPPKAVVAKEMLYALKMTAFLTALVFGLLTIPYSVGFVIDHFVGIEYAFSGRDVYTNLSILGFTVLGLVGVTVATVVAWYSGAKYRAKEKMDD